mmetsp:Transcript_57244/g.145389  ORF Transcript_57244/g.145389 Transcript_57244/m.145389 type:complete len:209 (+) Transcript_57244:1822-2448(+)
MHHDQRDWLLHETLDPLQIHGYEDIALVVWECASEDYLSSSMIQQTTLEKQTQGSVVFCKQHEVPRVRLLQVLLNKIRGGKALYTVHAHPNALEELVNAILQLVHWPTPEVSLNSLHQQLRLNCGSLVAGSLLLELCVDHTDCAVEFTHSPEVGSLLCLVDIEECFRKAPQVSLQVARCHHALCRNAEVFNRWRWTVQCHTPTHLGCI